MSEKDTAKRKDRSKSKEKSSKDKRDRERSETKSRGSSKENRHKEDSSSKHRRSSHREDERKPSDDTDERKRKSSKEHHKKSSHNKEEKRSSHHSRDRSTSKDNDRSRHRDRSSHDASEQQRRDSRSSYMDGSHLSVKPSKHDDRRRPSLPRRPSSALKAVVVQAPPKPVVPDEEYVYEDDFEDYSDDFEEDTEDGDDETPSGDQKAKSTEPDSEDLSRSSSEKERLKKYGESAMIQRILNRSEVNDSDSQSVERKVDQTLRITSAQRRIDFSNATATDFDVLSEASKRYEMLKNLVGMEMVYTSFLDMAPVRDYDFYMQMFGDGNRVQMQTQTGEEDLHREVQTEEIDSEIKWTQHPPTDDLGWGSAVTRNELKSVDINEEDSALELYKRNHLQSERLRKFIAVAAQVIIDLISSPSAGKELSSMSNRSNMKFSAGYNILSLGQLATASQVTCVRHNESTLLVAFLVKESLAEDIVGRGLLVEFKCDGSNIPERTMICEGEVRCCCYSPDGSSALFAGLVDGSCLAFDLQEPSSMFESTLPWPEAQKEYNLRTPAYDTSFRGTEWKPGRTAEPQAPIVDIHAVGDAHNHTGESYQVVSVNQVGIITIWTVIDVSTSSADLDLGLRPGATLKMNQTGLLKPDRVIINGSLGRPDLIVNTMLPNPMNNNQFLMGTDTGFILNVVRMKGIDFSGPRLHKVDVDVAAEVLCQRFSPFDQSIILAGLSNGHVSLYQLNKANAILVLIPPNSSRKPVTHVEFSPRSRSVFYSIHGGIRLLVWDIATGKAPMAVCDLNNELQSPILCTETWNQSVRRNHQHTTISFMALGLENGQLQVHALEKINKSETESSVLDLVDTLNNKL